MQELRPWFGRPPIIEPPDIAGYHLLRGEQLDLVRASILGILLVPIWWLMFLAASTVLGGVDRFGATISIPHVLVGISFAVILVIVHELIHGLAILVNGQRPSFGAGPGFFYTTCHAPLSRNAYIGVVLLPLLAINAGALIIAIAWPSAAGWMLFISILNTLGAGGDIWMFVRLLKIRPSALIVDLASGFAVYRPNQATTASPVEP